ncbi:MAG: superoxide dismutase [Verrucomicrobia bacterium]|jgi:nickel superoxide dismutase|nr:superoxide dismutase [Verrucomicrobiota bacterium]MBT7066948.1 superoxide dismutase [Verrucomicrobiota bacterium]MBT7701340.1 superoxide dismutase [Verrucomicrobiota bacterium]
MSGRQKMMATGCLALVCVAVLAYAHCQVPCGIYGDSTRFTMMREHVTTIEKSMKEIEHIGAAASANSNQLVRWVSNKEAHADELARIVTAYFMAQRIKPVAVDRKEAYAKYVKEVTLLHQILVYSMKTKQSTTLEHCGELRSLIDQFEKSYTTK